MTNQRTASLTGVEKYITLRRVVVLLTLALFLIALNRGFALLYGLCFLLLSAWWLGEIFARMNLQGLECRMNWPTQMRVGDEVSVPIHWHLHRRTLLQRLWPFNRRWVTLTPHTPWLQSDTLLMENIHAHTPDALLRVHALLRGQHSLSQLTLSSYWPLGITQQQRKMSILTAHTLVYPRIIPILARVQPTVGHSRLTDQIRSSNRAGWDEFREVNEYRPGDSMRHIAWRNTARTQKLMVRRFEALHAPALMLLPDVHAHVHAGTASHNTFEVAMTLCASIAHHAFQQGLPIGLAAMGLKDAGYEDIFIAPAHGLEHAHHLQHTLALLQARGKLPYAQALQRAQSQLPQGAQAAQWIYFHHPANNDPEANTTSTTPGLSGALQVFAFDAPSFKAAAKSRGKEKNQVPPESAESAALEAPHLQANMCWIRHNTDLGAALNTLASSARSTV